MAKKRKRSGAGSRAHKPRPAPAPSVEPRATPARRAHRLDSWLVGLAGLGIALTAYLTAIAWFGQQPAFCNADSDCDIVQSSRWSTLFGVPMPVWGLATYAILARLVWRLRSRPSTWRLALFFACIGAGVSWFLTVVSVVEIEVTCAYCLASLTIMNALLVLVLLRRPAQMPEHTWSRALPAPIGIALAGVLALHLHFSGVFDPAAGPEDPYISALATHLRESGAKFYGAYWCPRCQDQKDLFGASVDRLPYVECTPQGRNGLRAVACLTNDIGSYPTWTIGEQRLTGSISTDRLARVSGFQWNNVTQ